MSLPSSCLSWSFCLAPWFCIPSLLPTVWLWVHEGQGFSPQSYTANTKGNQLVYGWIYSEILLYITCAIAYKSRAQERVNSQFNYFSNKGWIEKGQIHLDIDDGVCKNKHTDGKRFHFYWASKLAWLQLYWIPSHCCHNYTHHTKSTTHSVFPRQPWFLLQHCSIRYIGCFSPNSITREEKCIKYLLGRIVSNSCMGLLTD